MNNLTFIIKNALEDFRRNKVRTLLTSLGILIGVSSVVLLNAFGLGLKTYIKNQFESLGTNLVFILPGQILSGGSFRGGGGAFSGIRFDERDYTNLRKVKLSKYVVPVYSKSVNFQANGKSELGDVMATTGDIFFVRNLEVDFGRTFDNKDVEKRSKIIVMGPKIAGKLFPSLDLAVGKTVKIESQGYEVVGILKSKGGGGFGGPDFDSMAYMPFKSAYSLNTKKEFVSVYFKASEEKDIPALKEEIKNILLKRYKEDEFSVVEQTEILNAVSSIFSMLNLVLVAIATISLVVGGIGIMNIMYVSVTERTKEIGIRRAIGAYTRDILTQFLTEAVILSLLGGILGLLVASSIVAVVSRFFPLYINFTSVSIALGVSSVIGVVFGVFPARKAAKLSPIEAIRYE